MLILVSSQIIDFYVKNLCWIFLKINFDFHRIDIFHMHHILEILMKISFSKRSWFLEANVFNLDLNKCLNKKNFVSKYFLK